MNKLILLLIKFLSFYAASYIIGMSFLLNGLSMLQTIFTTLFIIGIIILGAKL